MWPDFFHDLAIAIIVLGVERFLIWLSERL